jgi:rubrerythrin
MMSIRINWKQSVCSIVAIGVLIGCSSTTPPPLPPGNAADPQVYVPVRPPSNLLAHDETTLAIEKELSQTASAAKSAESMQHMGRGDMPGMQHGDMKMGDHQGMPNATPVDSEKKAVADEMKKTSDEMKQTSDEMKQKSEQTNSQNVYYTCRMHPQIHSDKPGKCPICGMTLIKKEGAPPK